MIIVQGVMRESCSELRTESNCTALGARRLEGRKGKALPNVENRISLLGGQAGCLLVSAEEGLRR